jgi:hypothetical protein
MNFKNVKFENTNTTGTILGKKLNNSIL